ncbi:MAG: CCA tRNA nucleotidyltransferase, partial [archaeon]|nr:CCA tRNA nucleotidyltransferase [archaeon]
FFGRSVGREELEKTGLKVGKSVFRKFGGNPTISYAEHPYTKGKIGTFDVEIVPAYKISSTKNLISAVDRTPFHTRYVLKNLKNNDEVRLLKKYLKGLGIYGSNLRTGGFSGYLCELLIIRYGTFFNTLQQAKKLRYQEIIDMENSYTKKEYLAVTAKFRNQPLIFIDPIDRNRNVAAVLSKENLAKFIFFASKFIDNPSLNYFYPLEKQKERRQVLRKAQQRGIHYIALTIPRPDLIDDVLYPQLRRFLKRVSDYLAREGFIICFSWEFADNDCGVAFELMSSTLPRFRKMLGPSIFDPKKNTDNFLKKYKAVWFEEDRMVSYVRRTHFDIVSHLMNFLDESEKTLKEKGVPNNIASSVKKGYSLVERKDLLDIDSKEFWNGLDRCGLNI